MRGNLSFESPFWLALLEKQLTEFTLVLFFPKFCLPKCTNLSLARLLRELLRGVPKAGRVMAAMKY
jgi:hypothetical protein